MNPDVGKELLWLERWYADQCDGEWEHGYGISISTLDNPGWSIEIDLRGTLLEGATLAPKTVNYEHETHWYIVQTEGAKFKGAGGLFCLGKMLREFSEFAEVNGSGTQSV